MGVNPSFAVDSIALIGTLAPVADFYCKRRCCVQVIALILQIWVTTSLLPGHGFYWRNPATSSVQDPLRLFVSSIPVYTVQLIVSNGTGIDTLTKTDYITVECLYSANRGIPVQTVQISVSVPASISQMKASTARMPEMVISGGTPNTSTDQNPQQICYYTPGLYSVTQIVYNQFGSDTLVLTDYINVNTCPLPVADFATFTPSFLFKYLH